MDIKNLYRKTKKHVGRNVRTYTAMGIGLSVLGMIGENVLNQIDMSKLEKTAIEVRKDSSHVANLYGFSDNGSGNIDRIEIRGTIPGFRGGAIMAYHRTVTPSDSDFQLQYRRLKK